MKRFSQKKGLTPIKSQIQKDFIDIELKNRLWNVIKMYFWNNFKHDFWFEFRDPIWKSFIDLLWDKYFKQPIDTIPRSCQETYLFIREGFFSKPWYQIYDFIEFLAVITGLPFDMDEFIQSCNGVLKEELSAYRFIGSNIGEITSDEEIHEIENAFINTSDLVQVQIHLKTALELFWKKPKTDYRNSIKESICAVESLCNVITKTPKSTLGQALNKIQKNNTIPIHGALFSAFSILYGWTSDAEGIRHGLMDLPDLDMEDAKYMLVSCSAFVNYLIIKAQKSKIPLNI